MFTQWEGFCRLIEDCAVRAVFQADVSNPLACTLRTFQTI